MLCDKTVKLIYDSVIPRHFENREENFVCVCLFALSRATPVAYGGSQARGPIRAVAAGLHYSSQQHWILNPLSKARDQPRNLMVPSRIH